MNIRVLSADALTPAQLAAWADIQRAEPPWPAPISGPSSPRPWPRSAAASRSACSKTAAEPVGFFPFQRGGGNVGRPVGGMMSDFHGVIARQRRGLGPAATAPRLRPGRLALRPSAGRADAVCALSLERRPLAVPRSLARLGRLPAGQLAAHGESFRRAMRKLRHADREGGPLRVELHTNQRQPSSRAWCNGRSSNTAAPASPTCWRSDWTVALLERIRTAGGEGFSGMMSALYMGDVLAAVLLSMRSYGVLHAWFSAYRPDLAALSPGLILWLELARLCPELGIRRIDMGKGPEEYKRHLMSGAIDVAEGSVDLRPVTRLVRRQWRRAYDWARRSPLRRPLLVPGRSSAAWSKRGVSAHDASRCGQLVPARRRRPAAAADCRVLGRVPRRA